MKPGDKCYWLYTLGGGGGSGHRENEKEPRLCEVVAVTPRSVKVRQIEPYQREPTWVRWKNVQVLGA
jgi:hypothetical protein